MPLILYFKDENGFGSDREAGLDAVARLVQDGICVAMKYAIVRADPRVDPYLDGLLQRVDRSRVVSGIGERPAIAHMRHWSRSRGRSANRVPANRPRLPALRAANAIRRTDQCRGIRPGHPRSLHRRRGTPIFRIDAGCRRAPEARGPDSGR